MRQFLTGVYNWIATDGLLHFLVCYALILTIEPLIDVWWAIGIVVALSVIKEAWDYFYQKDNNLMQVLHDLLCDAVGIIGALIVMHL